MAKWVSKSITIATRGKKEVVRAGFALGVYHVGRDEAGLFWVVTHIPTGMAFGLWFSSQERAMKFAERAHRKTGNWMPRAKRVDSMSGIARVTAKMKRAKAKDGRSLFDVLQGMAKHAKRQDW